MNDLLKVINNFITIDKPYVKNDIVLISYFFYEIALIVIIFINNFLSKKDK
jgi:hypothetical protein